MTSAELSPPLNIYHPEFDINTNTYVDFWPEKPRKTCISYICYCTGAGKIFSSKSEYSYHVKLKSHRLYISNYSERIENLETAKDYIHNLRTKNCKLEAENAQLKRQLNELTKPRPNHDYMVDLD